MSRETIVARLEEAGIDTERFINVNKGQKGTFDHTQYAPSDVSGNYGIYTNADDALAIFDVDDYDDLEDKSGLTALAELEPTFEQQSPHGGTHRLYRVETDDGRPVAEVLQETVNAANPNPSWGEIRVSNQYVVGAGSQLQGCDKGWCDECADPDGGKYDVGSDRAIATISVGDVIDVLQADPVYAEEFEEDDAEEDKRTSGDIDAADALSYALNESDDKKLKSLWRGNYSGYDDRSSAECALAFKLAFWLQGDKQAVREAMNGHNLPSDIPRPRLAKWEEREDDSYRDSVLEAVDKQTEYFEPSESRNQPSSSPKATQSDLWADIRWLYEDQEVSKMYARQAAVERLLGAHDFVTPRDTGMIWMYNEEKGFYNPRGETEIETILARELQHHYTQNELREILGQIRARTYIDRSELGAGGDTDLVCVGNGVYNLRTDELEDHSPDYYFTRGVDVDYNPDAEPEEIEQWLDDVVSRDEDNQTLLEIVGAALSPTYEHGKFLILFGEGSNGKSTFFELVEELLGQDNVSGWTLQDLSENRFANADLVGKFANVAPDMPGKRLQETGTLKTLTGGDQTMAERKGEDAFEFVNTATLMFGANRPPAIPEPSRAVKRRIVPIRFKQSFTSEDDDNPDKRNKQDLMAELTTEEEMEGLLKAAIEGLQRLRENGDVSLPETLDERLEYYEQFSDPIKEFRVNTLENATGCRVKKSNIYDAYTAYCHANDYAPTSKSAFWRELGKTTLAIDESRPQIDGEQVQVINNTKFTETGLEYAPSEVLENGGDTTPNEDLEDQATPLGEIDAEADEGEYVSVTVEAEMDVKNSGLSADDRPVLRASAHDETAECDIVSWDEHTEANQPKQPLTPWPEIEDDDQRAVFIDNARVSEYDGRLQLVLERGKTHVQPVQTGVGYTSPAEPDDADQNQLDTAADGGAEIESLKPQVIKAVQDHGSEHPAGVPREVVCDNVDSTESAVEHAIDAALEDGRLHEPKDDRLRKT
jgi:putative DNA primase/helicase